MPQGSSILECPPTTIHLRASSSQGCINRPRTDAWLGPHRQEQLIWMFLGLALVARAVRFLLCFPLWEDECFLVSNFIDCGYSKLIEPLNYHQVAPLGFLCLELTAVKLFGFSEWPLRLFPFACGGASLFLFRRLAGGLLIGPARLLAVAAFCASYSGIRYASEAKPYGPDQLVALVLVVAAVEWWRRGHKTRWLVALTLFTPVAISLSYPATFIAGGISVFIAAILAADKRAGWRWWLIYNAVLLTAFALVLAVASKGQSNAELHWMQDYWKEHLPSLRSPLGLILWFFQTHAGDLLAIPIGGEHGASTINFLLVTVGVLALARARQYCLLLLCLAPAGLNLVAAFMGRFPYGGHVKFSQYLAPAICLLLGVGAAALLSAGQKPAAVRQRYLHIALIVLALIPVGTMIRDFACPYKSPTDARYRDFARWFWPSTQFGGEVACLHSDLGLEFAPGTFHHLGWSAMYLCNQRIYSPRHQLGKPVAWSDIRDDWPLRCVEYRAEVYPYDEAANRAWLDSMRARYELVSREVFPSPVFDQRGQNRLCSDGLVIYKFIPRNSLAAKSQ